jgi:hypothetical protein
MAITGTAHTWTTKVTVPGLPALPADLPTVIVGDYAVEVEVAVPAGQVSLEVDVGTIIKTKIVSLVVNADLAAMEIYTNAADGTGGQHISLSANKSVAWNNTTFDVTQFPLPITQNITKFFVNNPGVKAGIFRAAFNLLV